MITKEEIEKVIAELNFSKEMARYDSQKIKYPMSAQFDGRIEGLQIAIDKLTELITKS